MQINRFSAQIFHCSDVCVIVCIAPPPRDQLIVPVKRFREQISLILYSLASSLTDAVIYLFIFQEAQSYADDNSLLFMETSAKTSMNVNEIFTAIGESFIYTLGLPSIPDVMLSIFYCYTCCIIDLSVCTFTKCSFSLFPVCPS